MYTSMYARALGQAQARCVSSFFYVSSVRLAKATLDVPNMIELIAGFRYRVSWSDNRAYNCHRTPVSP